jgi:hypothetical protein
LVIRLPEDDSVAKSGGGDVHNVYSDNTGSSPVVQARDIDTVNYYLAETETETESAPPEVDQWVRLVAESKVWGRVVASHPHGKLRELATGVAERLAGLRDELTPTEDPWSDPDLVRRFAERVDWLVERKIKPDLHPVEAILLTLVPLLHQCLWLTAADAYRAVRPTDFDPDPAPDDLRASYEAFLRNHGKLVGRATLPELPGRKSAHHEIGWWLFHRWLLQRAELLQPAAVTALLTRVGAPTGVLTTKWVRDLLYGLRVDPRWLTDERRISGPDAVETVFGGSSEEQPLHKHLVALVLGVAHTAAIEVTDLSDVLVWHMGIPRPVDVGELFQSVRTATWQHREDGPVLQASCEHEAVVEALREHASRLGDLLRAIRLVTRFRGVEPLRGLPSRATGDLVQPRTDDDGNAVFSGWSKFRLDEDRVRDLLMGEQLYQDRHMAIRELYQNALDACRYRQARETYGTRTSRPSSWTGKITFFQGVDENGRHYLDCTDNGIGMDIPELTGVFAQAGVRFAHLPEFREEQLDWQTVDPPVELYPNSRFGIGVLSYFMLADEIEVTTCRMGRDGAPTGPQLQVTISGPGQLFQIQRIAAHGRPGTTVRLYLRDQDTSGDTIRWLERVLAIAEFSTTTEHGEQLKHWEPGILMERAVEAHIGFDGLHASGEFVPAEGTPVVWCEEGGALLVDGLVVRPSVERGVVSRGSDIRDDMRGMVVNLTGKAAPRLSVDRTRVLDDVSDRVERLVVSALPQLLAKGQTLPNNRWIGEVAATSTHLADLIATALIENRAVLGAPPNQVDMAVAGWIELDAHLVDRVRFDNAATRYRELTPYPTAHILLWRLLAQAPNTRLSLLAKAVPEVLAADVKIPALPWDRALLQDTFNDWRDFSAELCPGDILKLASESDSTPRAIAKRATELGLPTCDPELFPRTGTPLTDVRMLSGYFSERHGWLETNKPVPISHFIGAHIRLGVEVQDVVQLLDSYGFDTSAARALGSPLEQMDLEVVRSGGSSWLASTAPVPVGHVLSKSEELGVPPGEIHRRLLSLGYHVEGLRWPEDACRSDLPLLSSDLEGDGQWLATGDPGPYRLAKACTRLGLSPQAAADRLMAFGFAVPDRIPDGVESDDLELLTLHDWTYEGTLIPPGHLLTVSAQLDVSPESAMARLATYGHRPMTSSVPDKNDVDLSLLSRGLNGRPPWLPPGEPVSATHLVNALVRLGIPLRLSAERLTAYGYALVDSITAEGLDQADPWVLKNGGFGRHKSGEPVHLDQLLKMSQATGVPVLDVAEQMRDIGLDVPDVRETVLAAIARLPKRSQTPPQVVQTNVG